MSTRANIVIKDSQWGMERELWFYRHCDGYPEGALPTLKRFCDWVRDGKIRDNVGQAAGWLILIGAEEYAYDWHTDKIRSLQEVASPRDDSFSGWKCGAYEPTTGEHGDIEFLYTIDLTNRILSVKDIYDGKVVEVPFDDIDVDEIAKKFGDY